MMTECGHWGTWGTPGLATLTLAPVPVKKAVEEISLAYLIDLTGYPTKAINI